MNKMITPWILGFLTTVSIAVCDGSVSKKNRTSTVAQNNSEGLGFEELVKRHTYVDKTLFIKDFLGKNNSAKVSLITNPRGFGKSTNTEMLTKFLKMNYDCYGNKLQNEFASLFANQHVHGENDLMKDYHSQFPVISVSFKGVSGGSYSRMKETFVENVLRNPDGIYESNRVLATTLSSWIGSAFGRYSEARPYLEAGQKFQQLLAGPLENITESMLETSISDLSFIFNVLFEKKVFIFVDDYDHPLYEAFTRATPEDQRKITGLFERLFAATFKDNTALERGLVSGVVSFTNGTFSTGLVDVEEHNILHNKFGKYYGFTKKEVKKLMDKRGGIPAQLRKKAEYLLDGYRTADNLNHTIYSPRAVSQFLQNRRIEPRERFGTAQRVAHFFRDKTVRQAVQDLIVDGEVDVALGNSSFTPETLRFLSRINGQDHSIRDSVEKNQVLTLLFVEGYLTLDGGEENRARSFDGPKVNATLSLPTRLEKYKFANLMVEYAPECEQKLFSIMKEVAENVQCILVKKNVAKHKTAFERAFERFLNEYGPPTPLKSSMDGEKTNRAREFLHSVSNMLAVSMNADYFETEILTQKAGDKAALLLMNTETRSAMVLEVRMCELFSCQQTEPAAFGENPKETRSLSERVLSGFVQVQNPFVDMRDIVLMDVKVRLEKTAVSVEATLWPLKTNKAAASAGSGASVTKA